MPPLLMRSPSLRGCLPVAACDQRRAALRRSRLRLSGDLGHLLRPMACLAVFLRPDLGRIAVGAGALCQHAPDPGIAGARDPAVSGGAFRRRRSRIGHKLASVRRRHLSPISTTKAAAQISLTFLRHPWPRHGGEPAPNRARRPRGGPSAVPRRAGLEISKPRKTMSCPSLVGSSWHEDRLLAQPALIRCRWRPNPSSFERPQRSIVT